MISTKIVTHAGVDPLTPLDQGVDATVGLATDPALDGVTGRYFDGCRESRPNPQMPPPAGGCASCPTALRDWRYDRADARSVPPLGSRNLA